jgi:hypothetical protein
MPMGDGTDDANWDIPKDCYRNVDKAKDNLPGWHVD